MELLEQILSNQNMNEAYFRVYRNKGASGVDGINREIYRKEIRVDSQRRKE